MKVCVCVCAAEEAGLSQCSVTLSKMLVPCSRVLSQKPIVTQPVNKIPVFHKSDSSLQYSQKSVTGLYPEPDKSSSLLRTLALEPFKYYFLIYS
jgi:hypothetical protein